MTQICIIILNYGIPEKLHAGKYAGKYIVIASDSNLVISQQQLDQ